MPERFARIAALALVVILIIALPLLIALFSNLASSPRATPTVQVAVLDASPTLPPATDTALPPTATDAPTDTPAVVAPTIEPTAPAPTCPQLATPEPLWVDPVVSPTDLLTQRVSVTLGRGKEIEISSEGGTISLQGDFTAARPVELEAPLAPNIENHLEVTGTVGYAPGCEYILRTRVDRTGQPLVIVQNSALAPLTAPPITPPVTGIVYLEPFAQVLALNQDAPVPADQLWLYTAPDPTAPFELMAREGAFSRLLSSGGTLNFWTLNDNVVVSPAPAPTFDDTVAGAKVEFVSSTIYACEAQYPRPLILGLCNNIPDVTDGEALQRATTEGSVLYLVRVNNRLYWVSSNVLKREPD